jgi:hypothetical protein
MKKCILLLLIASVLLPIAAYGYPKPTQILGPGLNSGRHVYHQPMMVRTLSADTLYYLTGQYCVDSLETINIPAGTIIEGDTAAVMIVERGAKVYATGTEQNPIVMCGMKSPGQRARGDWGGMILLGQAPVNKYEPLIEGGILKGSYGGHDPNDNSGIFRYVRIEYAGYRYQLNNEINGLTFGGVGRGTECHHIQVSYSFDDSYEWFGGTVDTHHLVAFGGTDDELDTDFGFSGRSQFDFCMRDPEIWDPTGESNGFESDNDASSTSTDEPHTRARFANVTFVEPERSDAIVGTLLPGNKFQYGWVIRRSSEFSTFNSVLAGLYWGVSIRDPYTQQYALADSMQIRDCSMTCARNAPASTSPNDQGRWAGVDAWVNTPAFHNIGTDAIRMPSAVGFTDMSVLHNPNPVPAPGSELIGSAEWTSFKIATDPWFQQATYRGAFKPGTPMNEQWTAGWTNFDPQWIDYSGIQTGTPNQMPSAARLEQNHPNPFNPMTAINFYLPATGRVTLSVFDVNGAKVATLVDGMMTKGGHQVTFNPQGLASGVYFYRLQGNGFNETRKMLLVR